MTREQAVKIANENNALGFEGDVFMKEKFKHIIESNNIKTVIETGTYYGATTRWMAKWVDKVYSIELNPVHFAKASLALGEFKNIEQWGGNSPECLAEILKRGVISPVFIFLDAHWDSYNPLLDELKVIAEAGIKPIIAIHDFKVPGHTELGFDTYNGQDYEWEMINESVRSIYENDYNIDYNSEASGAKRGVIYIYPRVKIRK